MTPNAMAPSRFQVEVDDREARSLVAVALAELGGVELQFKRLTVGDYIVDRKCVFERKTILDFANSIADGRLFAQARKLAALAEPAVIILEGTGNQFVGTHMRREAFQGAMICLSLIFRLPVLRALDAAETARLIIFAAQQIKRHEWNLGYRHGPRPNRKRKIQLRILQGLPGIGPMRAEQLLAKFGSVEAVMTATLENLEQVEGVGSKTAGAIREALQEVPPAYLTGPNQRSPAQRGSRPLENAVFACGP